MISILLTIGASISSNDAHEEMPKIPHKEHLILNRLQREYKNNKLFYKVYDLDH